MAATTTTFRRRPQSSPTTAEPRADGPWKFDRYGFRVPAVIVSPYARRDYVSHVVHDHTSILKLIETKWNLPPLTRRDAEPTTCSMPSTSPVRRSSCRHRRCQNPRSGGHRTRPHDAGSRHQMTSRYLTPRVRDAAWYGWVTSDGHTARAPTGTPASSHSWRGKTKVPPS